MPAEPLEDTAKKEFEKNRKLSNEALYGEHPIYGKPSTFIITNTNASIVYLIGDFNDWGVNFQYHPLKYYIMDKKNYGCFEKRKYVEVGGSL